MGGDLVAQRVQRFDGAATSTVATFPAFFRSGVVTLSAPALDDSALGYRYWLEIRNNDAGGQNVVVEQAGLRVAD